MPVAHRIPYNPVIGRVSPFSALLFLPPSSPLSHPSFSVRGVAHLSSILLYFFFAISLCIIFHLLSLYTTTASSSFLIMHHPYYSTSPVAQYANSNSTPNLGSPARVSPPITPYTANAHTYAYAHPAHISTPASAPARMSRPDVSTAMHNLITAMKHIQETLRLWSLAQASPEQVSDCYMQFGVEFNAIVRAFEGYGIGTGCVPLLYFFVLALASPIHPPSKS